MKKLKLYLMVGAPGCGKSTYSKKMVENEPSLRRICPDENRAKIGSGEGDQSVSYPAFCMAYDQLRRAFAAGNDAVIDATNMHRKGRKEFLKIAAEYNSETIAVVFERSREVLLKQIQKRVSEGGREVGEHVVDAMLGKYQRPEVPEFNKVTFVK